MFFYLIFVFVFFFFVSCFFIFYLFTAPRLIHLRAYRYWLVNAVLKFHEKKWLIFFYFTFWKGYFTCKVTETGRIRGAITSNTYLALSSTFWPVAKNRHFVSIKFVQFKEWMVWHILYKFQITEKSCYLNVLYHSFFRNKGGQATFLLMPQQCESVATCNAFCMILWPCASGRVNVPMYKTNWFRFGWEVFLNLKNKTKQNKTKMYAPSY